MAAETVLGLALGQLLKVVEEHMGEMEAFKSILEKTKSTLNQMKPIVENMSDLRQKLDCRSDGNTSEVLLNKINEGQELIHKCSEEMRGRCFCLKKPGYRKQLEGLYTTIKNYCDIVQLEMLSKMDKKVDKIMEGVDDLKKQRNSQGTRMQGNPPIGGSGSSRESKERSEQPLSGTIEANHGENLPSPPTNGESNLPPFRSPEIGRDSRGREDSHPTRSPNNDTSNLHPPKSPEIGNDVKSTGCADPSVVDTSTSVHRPSVSVEPASKGKGSPEEVGKPRQLECANPPDDKVSQGSLSGNTTSLAPVPPLVPSKVKGASNLHPPKSSEIENHVKSMVGGRDPSPVDSSASLHRPSASLEHAPKVKDSPEEVGTPRQLEYANPMDDKLSKGSLLGNTTSLAPVAPLVPSKVKGESNMHLSKSLEIGNDVKSTGRGDPSSVDFSASLHRPSASPEPAPKMKRFLEEVGKPRQLQYANPPDDKVNKGSLSGNTTSLAPVAPPVPSKVKGASNLHPPNEIGNDIESAGCGDPSLEDFSVSLHRPSASSEPASKVKGFLEEASKPRQLEHANPPDDKVSKRSLSDNTTSLPPVAPPVPSKVKASPEEPYKKIIGQDSKVYSNDPTRKTSVPAAVSDSLLLRTSITSPRLKELDEGANHIPNSRRAGHSISSEHNSTVAKDHIPRGRPTVPEKTPDAK